MRMGPVFIFPALAMFPLGLSAQSQASLGVGAGIVRHSGGSSFSALTMAPSILRLSPSLYLGAAGGISLLENEVWAGQGRADIWAAFPRRSSGFRGAISAAIGASTRSDALGAASGTALLEGLWNDVGRHGDGGVAVGGGWASGAIESLPGVGALRLRARTWWQPSGWPTQLTLTVEGTRFDGAWYTDVVGGATADRSRWNASLWVSARVSDAYQSAGAVSAVFQYFIKPSIALEAAGGNYLSDPFQGLPSAGFVTGGLRVYSRRRVQAHSSTTLQPLVAQRRGDSLVVRFRMPAARSVAIAGNWNAWTPSALRAVGENVWEAALLLSPGTYYFSLLVDGKDWVVPGGVALVPDGMGGMVAILTVL
ncbi:MAG TPA: glycogen-binding domain-containing protein [Gemmatimonadales bacterium]|nr:glycogen-binding domain-containing protein [Gemmatimonadales bacterium]